MNIHNDTIKPSFVQSDAIDGTIKKLEVFIQHIRDLDYVIDDKGKSLIYKYMDDNGQKTEDCLTDLLAKSISQYEVSKNIPLNKADYALKCDHWINLAITNGIIKEGHGLIKKLKNCSEENIILRKELETVSDSLMRAKEKIEELEQMIPSFGNEHA